MLFRSGPSCLSEQFTVNVSSQRLSITDSEFGVYPVPVSRGTQLIIQTGSIAPAEISLFDEKGMLVLKTTATGIWKMSTEDLHIGFYMIRVVVDGRVETRKVVVE